MYIQHTTFTIKLLSFFNTLNSYIYIYMYVCMYVCVCMYINYIKTKHTHIQGICRNPEVNLKKILRLFKDLLKIF